MSKLKKVKIIDIIKILYLLPAFICSLILKLVYRIRKQELWLVCETKNTARDNGIVFYKYMVKEHPEIKTYYAINKKCDDFKYLKDYKNIISFGSFKHFVYYMVAKFNISSHKEGNPNHAIFTVLHLKLNLFNNRVFLQHGVLYQNHSMFHQPNTKFKLFICGAKPEYEFIKDKYEYHQKEVQYTGLARFDYLHDYITDPQMILYIPTWRRWLENETDFANSLYLENINSFINNEKLEKILEENDKYLYFYPHMSSQKYMNLYHTNNKRVKIINASDINIQDLLKKASLMITDYSSVFTDFAYMRKPIIYYQYDQKDFMEKHIGKDCYDTYFNFNKDGFGPVTNNDSELLCEINTILNNNYKMDDKYLSKIDNFFILHDNHNCERIFDSTKKIK